MNIKLSKIISRLKTEFFHNFVIERRRFCDLKKVQIIIYK